MSSGARTIKKVYLQSFTFAFQKWKIQISGCSNVINGPGSWKRKTQSIWNVSLAKTGREKQTDLCTLLGMNEYNPLHQMSKREADKIL